MKNTNKLLFASVIILALALVAVFALRDWNKEESYYAVYLRTGDLYFGQLTRFPHFGLRNVYLLQVNRDNAQTPVSLQKFTSVFWGPEDYLEINRSEVVWTAKLSSAGQLAQLLKTNPNLTAAPSQTGAGVGNVQPFTAPSQTAPAAQQPQTSPNPKQ